MRLTIDKLPYGVAEVQVLRSPKEPLRLVPEDSDPEYEGFKKYVVVNGDGQPLTGLYTRRGQARAIADQYNGRWLRGEMMKRLKPSSVSAR